MGGTGQCMNVTFNPKRVFKINNADKNLINGFYPFYVNLNVGPSSGDGSYGGDGGGASDIRFPKNTPENRVLGNII